MVNNPGDDVLRGVAAEWLERPPAQNLIARDTTLDLKADAFITAIVGPRRAGKTSLMLHAADALIRSGKAFRKDFLFVDFEDYRLQGFAPQDIDRLLTVFHQLTGQQPRYLFFDDGRKGVRCGQREGRRSCFSVTTSGYKQRRNNYVRDIVGICDG